MATRKRKRSNRKTCRSWLMTAVWLCAPMSTKLHYFFAAQLSKQVLGCYTMHTLESFGCLFHSLSREAEGILTWVSSESSDSSVLFVTKVSHSHKILGSAENDQSCDSASRECKVNVKIQSKKAMFLKSIWLKFQHECPGMSCIFSWAFWKRINPWHLRGKALRVGLTSRAVPAPCAKDQKTSVLLETWKFCQTKSENPIRCDLFEVKAFNKSTKAAKDF